MTNFFACLALGGLLAWASTAAAQTVNFSAFTFYPMGPLSGPRTLAVIDVNGDGKPDILTADAYNNTAGVLLGNGNGTFPAAATMYPAGGTTASNNALAGIAVTDVDGDGKLDLLLTNSGSDTIGMLKGSGSGTFQAPVTYSTGSTSQPSALVVADMNGDGKPDVLTANYNTHKVGVLLGNASGTFQPVIEYATGTSSGPTGLAVADVNGDGKLDVLTANYPAKSVGMLLGSGTGTLQAAVTYATVTTTAYGITLADVTRDGKPDLLLADGGNTQVGVMPGNGNGTFQPGSTYAVPSGGGYASGPLKIIAADVNQDGFPDLVTANADGSASNLSGGSSVGVLLGSSSGTFLAAMVYSLGGKYNPIDIAVADVNADGQPDLVGLHYQANAAFVFLNATALPTRAALPGASASLSPNPASMAATLTLTGLPAAVAQVQATLLDATGRAVGQHRLPAAQGRAQAEVPLAGLAAGLYVVRLTALGARGEAVGVLPPQRLSVR